MLVSEEEEDAIIFPGNGRYAVVCDPIDGSSNLDAGVSVGTIFGVYRLDENSQGKPEDVCKPGTELVASGFTMYGASTQLVLTMKGGDVNGFTLDNSFGEFILTHPNVCPPQFLICCAALTKNRCGYPSHVPSTPSTRATASTGTKLAGHTSTASSSRPLPRGSPTLRVTSDLWLQTHTGRSAMVEYSPTRQIRRARKASSGFFTSVRLWPWSWRMVSISSSRYKSSELIGISNSWWSRRDKRSKTDAGGRSRAHP